jgi:CheY-like chemotaxis protein
MGKTLLVIDDDRDIREVARASLELVGGFSIIVAESGVRGIAVAQQTRPDADFPVASPAEPVQSVFVRLHEAEAATAPIVENDKLVGVITLENVTEYMMVHAALTTAKKKVNDHIKTDLLALPRRTAT